MDTHELRRILVLRLILDEDTWAGHLDFQPDSFFFEHFFNIRVLLEPFHITDILSNYHYLNEILPSIEPCDPDYASGEEYFDPHIRLEGHQLIQGVLSQIRDFASSMERELSESTLTHRVTVFLLKQEIRKIRNLLYDAFLSMMIPYCKDNKLPIYHALDPRIMPNSNMKTYDASILNVYYLQADYLKNAVNVINEAISLNIIKEFNILDWVTNPLDGRCIKPYDFIDPRNPDSPYVQRVFNTLISDWHVCEHINGKYVVSCLIDQMSQKARVLVSYKPTEKDSYHPIYDSGKMDSFYEAKVLSESIFSVLADNLVRVQQTGNSAFQKLLFENTDALNTNLP